MNKLPRAAGFILLVAFLSSAPAVPGVQAEEAEREPAHRPNIVFIIADDLGWADVGYNGSEIATPNIDRLAREGVRFERHYVMPTCTPTRVGLMTGRYPSRYGVLSPAYGKIFPENTVTLASVLRENGYKTSICGKWHMGSPPVCVPLQHGFKTSYGYFHGQIDPYTHLYKTGVRSWHRNDQYLEENGHATDLITREAVRIIASQPATSFFLYVAYSVPHFPLDEPEKWTAMYEGRIEEWSRRLYAASVTHMDRGIGDILEALERTDQRSETVVIFVSDNGGQKSWSSKTQYKGRYADKPHKVLGDNRPLRGWKGQVYEGGIRVPGLIHWPGRLQPGTVRAPVHVVDWMPTLCRLAGCALKKDSDRDGRDIWPLISGRVETVGTRTLYWKTPSASALRHGDLKLIVDRKGQRTELYDVAADPFEKEDLASKRPDDVARMKARLGQVAADDRER